MFHHTYQSVLVSIINCILIFYLTACKLIISIAFIKYRQLNVATFSTSLHNYIILQQIINTAYLISNVDKN